MKNHWIAFITGVSFTAGMGAATAQGPPNGERNSAAATERDKTNKSEAQPRKPRSLKKTELSCAQKKRAYRESQECFARFRNANASVDSDAFKHCTEIKQPQC